MTYKEVRAAFPVLAEWKRPNKDGLRLRALGSIPRDDLIVISKLSEMIGEVTEFNSDNMKWMYLFADEPNRKTIIKGYRQLIEKINSGKVKVC